MRLIGPDTASPGRSHSRKLCKMTCVAFGAHPSDRGCDPEVSLPPSPTRAGADEGPGPRRDTEADLLGKRPLAESLMNAVNAVNSRMFLRMV